MRIAVKSLFALAFFFGSVAVAQDSRPASAPAPEAPASAPASRPTKLLPWTKFAVGAETRFDGTIERHFDTPEGEGSIKVKVAGRMIVLAEEKPGYWKLAWIVKEEVGESSGDFQPQRAITFYYDAKAQSLVEAPGDGDAGAVANGTGIEDRPMLPRFNADELHHGVNFVEDRDVDSGGVGLTLRLPQGVRVSAIPDSKDIMVAVAPSGKGPFKAKVSLPHVPEGAEVKIEGIEPMINEAREEYVFDVEDGSLRSATIVSDLDLNEDISIKTTTSIKRSGKTMLAAEVTQEIAAATAELHAALRMIAQDKEAAKKKLEGFEARYKKAGLNDVAESLRKMADLAEEEGDDEEMDGGDGDDHKNGAKASFGGERFSPVA